MNAPEIVSVTIMREIEITVDVGFRCELAPTWWDQGEPAEIWIEGSVDRDGEVVELDDIEVREALKRAQSEREDSVFSDGADDIGVARPF
jgi:hypothetical protein